MKASCILVFDPFCHVSGQASSSRIQSPKIAAYSACLSLLHLGIADDPPDLRYSDPCLMPTLQTVDLRSVHAA